MDDPRVVSESISKILCVAEKNCSTRRIILYWKMHLRVRNNRTCTFIRYNANELPRVRYKFRYVINNLSRTNFTPAFIYFYTKIAEAISEAFL